MEDPGRCQGVTEGSRSLDRLDSGPATEFDRLDSQEHGALGVNGELPPRAKGELVALGNQPLVGLGRRALLRDVALPHRGEGEHESEDGRDAETRHHRAPDPATPSGRSFSSSDAVGEEAALVGSDGDAATRLPRFELTQAAPAEQVRGILTGIEPLRLGQTKSPVEDQRLPACVQPATEPVPMAEEGLVGYLDGRTPGEGIAVEGEQASVAELREHLVN